MNEQLKPCPCGGKTRLTSREYRFFGHTVGGLPVIGHQLRVICNRCKMMGKPVRTSGTYENVWGFIRGTCGYEAQAFFEPYAQEAITAWNNRPVEDALRAEIKRMERKLRDCKCFIDEVFNTPNCNACDIKRKCTHCPPLGHTIRFNCPLRQDQEETPCNT